MTYHARDSVLTLHLDDWRSRLSLAETEAAVRALEGGAVLFLPQLAFPLAERERRFLSPAWHDGKAKNISFDLRSGAVRGAKGDAGDLAELGAMLRRFTESAQALCQALLPHYRPPPTVMRTSLRALPCERDETSWRRDDRRLHVDAFPSRPSHGARILRVFCNVNPRGEARVWRIGEPFADVAQRFFPRLAPPRAAVARTLAALHVTKGVRSAYDHYMLELHDHMKADATYQREAAQVVMAFPSGTTWVCFSDQVSHAATRGQHMLEQTLQLAVSVMREPAQSPLRVLERLAGRPLV